MNVIVFIGLIAFTILLMALSPLLVMYAWKFVWAILTVIAHLPLWTAIPVGFVIALILRVAKK
jgi:hypothetical protein